MTALPNRTESHLPEIRSLTKKLNGTKDRPKSNNLAELQKIHERLKHRDEMADALVRALCGVSKLSDDGKYIYVNQAYARILRTEPGHLVGKKWETTVAERHLPNVKAAHSRMLFSGRGEAVAEGVRADGSRFWKLVVMVPVKGGFYCFMNDISHWYKPDGS